MDVRTYKLVPGGVPEFDRIFRDGALPMLRSDEWRQNYRDSVLALIESYHNVVIKLERDDVTGSPGARGNPGRL